jgi:hypothetical protein
MEKDYHMNITNNDTVIGNVDMKALELILKQLVIMNVGVDFSYNVVNGKGIIPIIFTGREEETDVPVLKHPVFMEMNERTYCFVDFRHICKFKEGVKDVYEMTNNREHLSLELNRLILSMLYYKDRNAFSSISPVVAKAQSAWITTTLTSTLSLSIVELTKLEILTSFYFHFLLINQTGDYLDDSELVIHRVKQQIGDDVNYFMDEILGENRLPTDLNEYIGLIPNISPKFTGFNIQTLLSLLNGTIFLPNPTFLIASALEYPPAMITVIDAVLTQRINNRVRINNKISKIRDIAGLLVFVKKQQQSNLI